YYDDKNNVDNYITNGLGYDGSELINILKTHLPQKSKVLEIGMGPGKDFEILSEDFITTGSDKSEEFFNRYIKKNRNSDVLLLDAVTLETNRFFDCIYTNKVLHLLTKDDLDKSLKRQSEILLDNGLVFHTFWEGEEDRVSEKMFEVYYDIERLVLQFEKYFKIIEIKHYTEFEDDDSIYVIARKK
ncbi:MAG: methyltransferase domain-containing protein, partial [Candidatus Heimdallarchaeota archaeon]